MIDDPTDDRSPAQRTVYTNANVLDGVRAATAGTCVVVERISL
jgi:hypothetical protein